MRRFPTWQLIAICVVVCLILSSCSSLQNPTNVSPNSNESLDPTQPKVSLDIVEETPTQTLPPTATSTPTQPPPTATPTQTPTPTWVFHEAGKIDAPILLYHQVENEVSTNRYQVSIPDFRAQMAALQDMGFTVITISHFLEALLDGSELPEKPIVITFDDGHESVYMHAFPIMQEFGYPGVFYIVANRINDVPEFLNVAELKEMIAAGWEIGSHSYTHADLTKDHSIAAKEIGQSKSDLEAALSTSILTFAYPYGTIDRFTAQKVSDYNYRAGMGLGKAKTHTWNTLFYLDRIEIYGNYTLEDFYGIFSGD
ncbi:MAG: polysaccharide deacetylase family protein [Chloroflexota bacterium]|nr:polysaccharide deacetylase family protein [Chloroflexota bacterium]